MNATHKTRRFLFAIVCMSVFSISLSHADELPNKDGDFARGALAWAQNCSRCHNTRSPQEFRDDLWRPIVYHMRVRAGLTGQETRDILKYLTEAN